MIPHLIAQVTFVKPDGSYIPVGRRVPDDLFTAEQVERLIKKGAITTVEIEQAKLDALTAPKKASEVEMKPDWGFDPAEIANDTLETLNMKILERATQLKQEIPPFDDVETARLFMTSEWKPEN